MSDSNGDFVPINIEDIAQVVEVDEDGSTHRTCLKENSTDPLLGNKVWLEKKFTHISLYFSNLDCFGKKSFKLAKSTHAKDFKMVRQVHIVQKLFSGRMINHKNNFWEITNFVNK